MKCKVCNRNVGKLKSQSEELCGACYQRRIRHGTTALREHPKKSSELCSKCHRDPVHAKDLCKHCYGVERLINLNHGKCNDCGKFEKLVARDLCHKCYSLDIQKRKSAVCIGCSVFKPIKAKGMCRMCYMRFQRYGDPTKGDRPVKGAKLCSECNKKPVHAKDMCGGCYSKYLREKDPDKYLEYELQKNFGISVEEYNFMLEKQGGMCAICCEPETSRINGKTVRLAVDHSHTTGEVRGLLCGNCNRVLGYAKDSPDLLQRAIDYLKTS